MANSEVIKSSDLIEKGVFAPTKKEAEELLASINELTKSFSQLYAESAKGLKNVPQTASGKEIKETTKALAEAEKQRKALLAAEKLQERTAKALAAQEAKRAEQERKNSAEYIKNKAVEDAANKARVAMLKAIAIEQSKTIGLEQRLLATNARLRLERAALTGQESNYKQLLADINSQLDANNAKIKENSDKLKQQSMNVGNYSESIQDALEKSGVFGGLIQKLTTFVEMYEAAVKTSNTVITNNTTVTNINTVATEINTTVHEGNTVAMQAETAATEKLSLAKRALNAITSPVGLLIAGAAAVAALTKAVYDVNQSLQDLKDLGQAFLKDKFWGTGEAFQDLQKATVQLRKDMIGLTQDLQKLNDIASDKGFDFQDETKNLNFRKQAYEDYVNFRIKASEKEIEIATREKEIADQAVRAEESRRGVGKGNALKEFYDKQSEAVQKLYDANDKYLDLTTQVIPKERRKMINDEIIQEIELLRSKKLGADSAVETLKNQVADETLLLEKRQKAFQKLTEEQLKAQNEEFLLLEKFGLQRAELDDLLATKDAVALQRKITDLGLTRLGIEQQNELAKVIVETQKNELDRAAALDKIDAKRKENLETIATLEKEIARIQTDREIFEAQELVAEKQKKSNELLQDSLSKTFLFSTKVKKAALNALQEEFEATASEFELLQNDISNKAKEAIDAVKKQMAEEKKEREIGAKEIEKIIKERDAELAKLQDKATAKATESEAKKQKFIQKLEAERTVETLAQIGKVTTAFEQQLTNRQALQDSARQYEISQTERQIDTQKTLAEKGLANELAFQEEKRNKQELASRDAQEKQQRQKQAIDLANNFNSFLQARLKQTPPPNEGQAIAGALSDTLLAQGIAKGLVQFAAEGNNMIQGAGTETSDSIPFMLSKNEAVIKASENKKHNDAVVALNAGVFDKLFVPKYEVENVATKLSSNTASNIGDSLLLQSNQEVIKLLKEIKEKPTQHIDIDKLGNFVETVYEKGAKNTTIHKPKIRLR